MSILGPEPMPAFAAAAGMPVADPVPPGMIRFYDAAVPVLTASDYQIVLEQKVTLPSEYTSPEPYVKKQRFKVTGPHFGLGANDVASVFPPLGGQGDFSTALCHVVLQRATLPWEIPLDVAGGAGADEAVVAPWMAVLLVAQDEVAYRNPDKPPGDVAGVYTVPLRNYLRPGPPDPPGIVGPTFTQSQVDEFLLQYGDQSCAVVELRADVWNAVAPRSTELPFLAHVRQVDPEDQEIVTGTREDEWFSVIVGNCVPRGSSSTLYVAYLVSLEGFESYLPDRGEAPRGTNLRLLALASWTFNSRGRDLFFKQLMADLDVDVLRLREAPEPDGKVIRATTTSEPTVHALPPVEQVAAALGLGYTALDYQTRVGERTAAWYRGPCLPVDMRRNMQPPYTTAESALIYEPTDGMFDVSYAVDWQTGRLLALADRQFAVSLLRWVREGGRIAQLLQERIDLFGRIPFLAWPEEPASMLGTGLVRSLASVLVASSVVPALVPEEDDTAGALGGWGDPSGVLRHAASLPGILTRAEFRELMRSGCEPEQLLLSRRHGSHSGE